MHLYLDVDDVLAETTRAIADLAAAMFGKRVAFDDMHVFDLEVSLRLDAEQSEALHCAIHEDAFLERLLPFHGAVDLVRSWHDGGSRISVVTGRPPRSRRVTHRWLDQQGLPHHELHVVDKYDRYRGPDVVHLRDLETDGYDVAIEDSPSMATHLADRGVPVLLLDRPWNRRAQLPSGVKRVHSWGEIAGTLG